MSTTKWSGGSPDDKRGRAWAMMTGLVLALAWLAKVGSGNLTAAIIFFLILEGLITWGVFRNSKNSGSDPNDTNSTGAVLMLGLMQFDFVREMVVNGTWHAATDQMLAMQLIFNGN